MTDDELRMLDAEVHRKVMRLECHWDDSIGWWCYSDPVARNFAGEPWVHLVPAYATDIAAAWQVVEKMRAAGHSLVLEDWRHHMGDLHGWAALFDLANGHDTGQHVAPTAPLAICLASLMAVGVKK